MAAFSSPYAVPSKSLLALAGVLFWQVSFLAFVAGVLSMRHAAAGALLFLLFWWLDFPRCWQWRQALVLVLAFCCGFLYATQRSPVPPPVPEWLAKATTLYQDAKENERLPGALRIRAFVSAVEPRKGKAIRLLLQHTQPVAGLLSTEDEAFSRDAPVYSGTVSATVYGASEVVYVPGQWIEATLRFAPVRGMKNTGTWDMEEYWHDRGVWFRAWASAQKISPVVSEDAGFFAQFRSNLHQRFIKNLPYREWVTAEEKHAKGAETAQKSTSSENPFAAAALLPALVFGDRSLIEEDLDDLFARATLSHSLALSGLHLGFVVLLGGILALGWGALYASTWLRLPKALGGLLFALPLAVGYMWLGQYPVSLVRAACMLFFWAVLLALQQSKVLLDGLFFAVIIIVLYNPLSLFALSFQLSALSIVAIAVSLPFVERASYVLVPIRQGRGNTMLLAKERAIRRLARGVVSVMLLSFCIQVALAPVTVSTFGTAGLWFPLNAFWLPLLGFFVMPAAFAGLLFTALGLDAAAHGVLFAAAQPCRLLLFLLNFLDTAHLLIAPVILRPHWLTCAGFWCALLFFPSALRNFFSRKQKKEPWKRAALTGIFGSILFLLPFVWAWSEAQAPAVRVRVVDVGQGQAVLLEWQGLTSQTAHTENPSFPVKGRVLVDGGGFATGFDVGKAIIAPLLTENSLPRLEKIIATHPDFDHMEGVLYPLKHFSVGEYITNGATPRLALAAKEHAALRYSAVSARSVVAGDVLELAEGLRLEVLWPPAGMVRADEALGGKENKNEASLVLRLVWQEKPLALFCGDAEMEGVRWLSEQKSSALSSEVLVLPHHGSAKSHLPDFYTVVAPSYAVASCGYANIWGFPSASVRKTLQAMNIPLYTTAKHGEVVFSWISPKGAALVNTARSSSGTP